MKKQTNYSQTKWLYILGVIIVTLIGTALRFWNINNHPPGLFPDQAINALEAIYFPIEPHYDNWGYNEAAFVVLLKFFFHFVGANKQAITVLSATIGTISIPLFMILINRLEGKTASILGGIFIATSGWHIALSRSSDRYSLFLLITILMFTQLIQWYSKRGSGHILGLAALLSLGFYTYTAQKITLLLLPTLLFFFYKKNRASLNETIIFITANFIALMPLLLYIKNNFNSYTSRLAILSIFSGNSFSEAMLLLLQQLKSLIVGLFIKGPNSAIFNIEGRPIFHPVVAILVLVGIASLINKMALNRDSSDKAKIYLLSLGIFTLPALLAYEPGVSAAHGARLLFFMPCAFLIAAIGGIKLIKLIQHKWQLTWIISFAIISIGSLLSINSYKLLSNSFNSALEAHEFRKDLYLIGDLLKSNKEIRDYKINGSNIYLLDSEFMRFSLDFYLHDSNFYNRRDQLTVANTEGYNPVYMDFDRIDEYNQDSVELKPNDIIILPAFSALEDQGYFTLHSLLKRYPEIYLAYTSEVLTPEDSPRHMFKIYQLLN